MSTSAFASAEIPWPAAPDTLERDEEGDLIVGKFRVGHGVDEGWFYYDPVTTEILGRFDSEYDAVNEGALRDDYREE